MKSRIYRNIDRPFVLLGIKGRYIVVAGMCIFIVLVISSIIGWLAGTFAALAATVILLIISYLALVEIQQKFSEKNLARRISGIGLPKFIIVRRCIWRR